MGLVRIEREGETRNCQKTRGHSYFHDQYIKNTLFSVHDRLGDRSKYDPKDACGTLCGWCNLDDGEQHLVAQPQIRGCTSCTTTDEKTWTRRKKKGTQTHL
jgi:hypothetical protein